MTNIFGPIPSRRLGRSMGINNIPPKFCTYSCVYCQLGATSKLTIDRKAFFEPKDILKGVEEKVLKVKNIGENIDYLTFVPDGEPTLDVNLGAEISLLKGNFDIKIAVITNGSLLWRPDVREELMDADLVSLKVDAVTERVWKRINRPHRGLKLEKILQGISKFSKDYQGKLITETMLVKGINDNDSCLGDIANYISQIEPDIAYISIPIRPPAEDWVKSPDEEHINMAYQIFSKKVENTEYLIGHEGEAFSFSGDIEEDILSITSVHPMRKDAMEVFLKKANSDWSIVKKLISQKKLIEISYNGNIFYMRNLSNLIS
ncbi:MAG: radical SAM protein [Candidatus Methanospirareceae archaeon]